MSEGEVYSIMNLEKYAAYIRKQAANSFTKKYHEDLDQFVTIKQMCKLVEENSLGKDDKGRYLLDETGHEKLFEATRLWLYNTGLSKLAAQDLLECAWDSKLNQMVFWGPAVESSSSSS